jgi:hypothetical protein
VPECSKQAETRLAGFPTILGADRSCWSATVIVRQIEANRRNARLSTGPVTEDGKRTSRQNALRHGLMAETVIDARWKMPRTMRHSKWP